MARRDHPSPPRASPQAGSSEPHARFDGDGFRLRGTEVTRLEGFSDAMFAFALTLLVVSLEVPHTFAQLKLTLSGFLGFALCFLWLVSLWYQHRTFFRRYGLDDQATIAWNMVLLFLVMFFVYPLKFLVSLMMALMFGIGAERFQADSSGSANDGPLLLIVYGLGYLAVHLSLLMMHRHALAKREELELNPVEVLLTHESIWAFWIQIGVAAISILIAWIGGPRWVPIAGWSYLAIGPARGIHGGVFARKIRALHEAH